MGLCKINVKKTKRSEAFKKKEVKAHDLRSILFPEEGSIVQKKDFSEEDCAREDCLERSIIIVILATKYSTHLHTLDLEYGIPLRGSRFD
jgi:hypothetical protein